VRARSGSVTRIYGCGVRVVPWRGDDGGGYRTGGGGGLVGG
jgi:hypothetical protein